jgi:hypothetical protein
MADEAFRDEQRRHAFAPHVQEINRLVDMLRDGNGRGWAPYVAPWHGGVEARVLSLLRDPGPKTQEDQGSGFLCTENDDPTAAFQAEAFAVLGIKPRDVTPWNAYPWYINRAPKVAEMRAGTAPLRSLVGLMPQLRVVLLQGIHAQRAWSILTDANPDITRARVTVVSTYHPGRQALFHPDPEVRAARSEHRLRAYAQVAAVLGD